MQTTTVANIVRNDVVQGTVRTISYTKGNVTVNCLYNQATGSLYANGSVYDGRRYRKVMRENAAIDTWKQFDDEFETAVRTLSG